MTIRRSSSPAVRLSVEHLPPGVVRGLLPVLGLAAGVAVWAVATAPGLGARDFVTAFSPAKAIPMLWTLLRSGAIWPHLVTSLKRVVIGLSLACAMGIPMGLLVGYLRSVEQSTRLLFQFLRMTSPLSWTPVAIVAFGIGDLPVYFLLAIAAVWPIILNTAAGVEGVERRWVLMGRTLGAAPWETVRSVVLPAIATHLFTGLRLALGLAWIVLVPAEMLGVPSGLGYYILDTRDRLAYPELMAVIVLIGLVGYLLDAAIRFLRRRWVALPSLHDAAEAAR
jgi:NitT/TauT family transport system permease protein